MARGGRLRRRSSRRGDHVRAVGGPGTVEVRALCEDEKVVVVVADEGRGMLPRTDSPGLGLGLPLIAQMTQSLEVHDRQGGGTEIRMSFALNATA
jgi:signal transduction histidine kinase